METEWNKLDDATRADFAVWREQRQTEALAKARTEAAKAAAPKRYADMTPAEQAVFRRQSSIPQPRPGARP